MKSSKKLEQGWKEVSQDCDTEHDVWNIRDHFSCSRKSCCARILNAFVLNWNITNHIRVAWALQANVPVLLFNISRLIASKPKQGYLFTFSCLCLTSIQDTSMVAAGIRAGTGHLHNLSWQGCSALLQTPLFFICHAVGTVTQAQQQSCQTTPNPPFPFSVRLYWRTPTWLRKNGERGLKGGGECAPFWSWYTSPGQNGDGWCF